MLVVSFLWLVLDATCVVAVGVDFLAVTGATATTVLVLLVIVLVILQGVLCLYCTMNCLEYSSVSSCS